MSPISTFYHRHAAANTSSKPVIPAVIPFRNAHGELRYTSAPTLPEFNIRSASQYTSLGPDYHSDSDGIPLLASPSRYQELTDDERARFTATGRPMRPYAGNPLQSLGGDMFTAPRYLPKQYTDESIIPVIVVNVIPSQKQPELPERKKRSMSITSIFKGEKPEKDANKKITKIVFMPRGEYLKQFAKDDDGNYIGTMPQKEWTEDELDEKFKCFRPLPKKQKGAHGSWNSMTTGYARGSI